MGYTTRSAAFLLLAGLFLILGGCATKVIGLRHDPSFTYDSIAGSRIAIGGVASSAVRLSRGYIRKYNGILREEFLKQRPGYPMAQAGLVESALGKKAYLEMLDDYSATGTLSAQWASAIKASVKDVRYVVFARLGESEITYDKSTTNVYKKSRNAEGKEIRHLTGYNITLNTRREMSASLRIHDLDDGRYVWGGTVSKSPSNSKFYTVRFSGIKLRRKYPKAPKVSEAVRKIFSGFAENLPGPPKK